MIHLKVTLHSRTTFITRLIPSSMLSSTIAPSFNNFDVSGSSF
jgi:hypothetical protein